VEEEEGKDSGRCCSEVVEMGFVKATEQSKRMNEVLVALQVYGAKGRAVVAGCYCTGLDAADNPEPRPRIAWTLGDWCGTLRNSDEVTFWAGPGWVVRAELIGCRHSKAGDHTPEEKGGGVALWQLVTEDQRTGSPVDQGRS
jgi:hypothetical protein